MIKTAYVRKKRTNDDAQSTRSRASAVTVFSKSTQQVNGYNSVPSAMQYSYPIPLSPHLMNPSQQNNNSQAFVQRFKQKIPDVPIPKIQRLNEDV